MKTLLSSKPVLVMVAMALLLPWASDSGFMLSLLCQMGIMMIFALSYNMLLGQTGLLSFGHAVYYGLGAFMSLHALNALGKSASPLMVAFLPLVGGLTGMFAGLLLGYISTRRAGTTFSMITLGIGELVAASSLMFKSFFGGEGGISGNRMVSGATVFGINWGSQLQMYALIVVWVAIAATLMWALTKTPLGRMANAVRDNPERSEFVGYNPQMVRYWMLVFSGGFAGIAGGLMALNYEIVTAEAVGTYTSGVVLLMSFVGGIGFFYGPMIGAVLITLLQSALASKAWLLYFGTFFIFMVLWVPGGVASLIHQQSRLWRAGLLKTMLPHYLLLVLPLLASVLGGIALVEMTYAAMQHGVLSAGLPVKVLKNAVVLSTPTPWLMAAALLVCGALLVRWLWRRAADDWQRVQMQLLKTL